jgi:inner membrane protein
MQFRLAIKFLVLGVLAVLFTVVFAVIGGIRADRERYRAQVVREVSQSTAGPQVVTGPLLVVPYRQRTEYRTTDSLTGRIVVGERLVDRQLVVLPDSLSIAGTAAVDARKRGIHEARVLDADLMVNATFRAAGPAVARDVAEWGAPFVVVGVTDSRGLRRTPEITWNGAPMAVTPGSRVRWATHGFAADPGAWSPIDGAPAQVRLRLRLTGTERLSFVPVGKETEVRLTSPWPHPSFQGRILPDTREIRADGFQATWHLSHFASGIEDVVPRLRDEGGDVFAGYDFGVSFISPIDVYRLTDRAVKYGMLFVLLTFVGFLLFEVLRRLDIHPVQYGLVGFALATFFLLLLSLSEHIAFAIAYLLASAACLGLIIYYVTHVLRSRGRALGFGAGLAALYALLYVVLRSEDYALLLGTLVVFGVLAFVMVATRRVDWSRAGDVPPEA